MSKKSKGVIYKSDILRLYSKITGIENSYQKTITDWLNELKLIFNSDYFNSLNLEEKVFFEENIKILIDGQKDLNYKTAVFFIPLLLTYNSNFIKNTIHNKHSSNSVFIDWFYEILSYFKKLGIEIGKENYIIENKDDEVSKIIKNKKYSATKKGDLVREIRKSNDENLKLFFEEMNKSYCISLKMYTKLDTIIRADINNKFLDIFNEISNLPLTSKYYIMKKIDNIVKDEIENLKINHKKYKNQDSYEKYIDEIFDYLEYKSSKESSERFKQFEYNEESEYSLLKQIMINE